MQYRTDSVKIDNAAKREYWANLLKSRDAKPKGSKGKTMTAGCYWKFERILICLDAVIRALNLTPVAAFFIW